MEGISSSDRARKLFERVVDIVTTDFVQERPNSLRTPHRDTSASQIGVSGSSSENSRLSARINSATPEYSRLFGFQSKRKDSKKDQKNKCKGRSASAWVHDCICLAVHDQDWLPTAHDKMNLASWGLGLKRLSFPREASSAEINTIVYGSFPQLSGRGYDILRTGPKCKSLVVIATPPGGMTIPYMMDIVQQSKNNSKPTYSRRVEKLQRKRCSSDKSPRAFRSKGAERAVEVSSSASDMEQQSSPFVTLLDESEEEFDKQLKLAIGASLLESNTVVDAVGGSPPTFLANSIVDYMLYGIEGVQLRINNIPDIALQKVLKELEDASSVSEFQEVLTAAAMIDLFQVEYSSCGSNNRQKEEASIIMFYDYLQDIDDGKVFLSTEPTKVQMALEKVLQFTTGSRSIPPLGFDSSPTINFCHDPAVTLPTSNTCSMSITLPTAIINVDTFSSRMTYGIGNSLGCLGHSIHFILLTFGLCKDPAGIGDDMITFLRQNCAKTVLAGISIHHEDFIKLWKRQDRWYSSVESVAHTRH
eukprot:Em0009g563a